MPRDKFASMAAAAAAAPRRDKFAAVQQRKLDDELKQQRQALQARCHQRDAVWDDIAQAEAAVTQLLELAARTVDGLVQNTTAAGGGDDTGDNNNDNNDPLWRVQAEYRDTVANIHRWLSPHAHLVQAYQEPQHVNRMYVQRVEHRLAESRLELMQELMLDQQEHKGDDNNTTAADGDSVDKQQTKRKRDEMQES